MKMSWDLTTITAALTVHKVDALKCMGENLKVQFFLIKGLLSRFLCREINLESVIYFLKPYILPKN